MTLRKIRFKILKCMENFSRYNNKPKIGLIKAKLKSSENKLVMESNLKNPFKDFVDQHTSKILQQVPQELIDEIIMMIQTLIDQKSDYISSTNILLASIGQIFMSSTILQKFVQDPNWQINCSLFISKWNGEIIPIFLADSLKEAQASTRDYYLSNLSHSGKGNWNFWIASDFLHWTLYAFDQKERNLWTQDFDISNSTTSTESICALIKLLSVLIGYNEQNIEDKKPIGSLINDMGQSQSKDKSTAIQESSQKGVEQPNALNSRAERSQIFWKFIKSQQNNPQVDNLRFWK